MSENDIAQWMGIIQSSVWTGLGKSAPEIVDSIGARSAALLSARGYKWAKGSGRKDKQLASAVAGQDNYTDSFSKTENEITAERKIDLPYAKMVEEGGDTRVTSKSLGKMYALYKETKDIKYLYAFLSRKFGKGGSSLIYFEHKPNPFLAPIIDSFDNEMLERLITPSVMEEFNKVKDLEITIGS